MTRYILIESGPIREEVDRLMAERDAATKAWTEWASKHGAKGAFHDETRPVGVDVEPSGPDWKKKRAPIGHMWSPKVNTKEGKSIAAEMQALPKAPSLGRGCLPGEDSIDRLLGWESGNMRPAYLIRDGAAIAAVMPGHGIFGDSCHEDLARLMAWEVPEGCREITEAECYLIAAKQWVAEERAAAGAGGEA